MKTATLTATALLSLFSLSGLAQTVSSGAPTAQIAPALSPTAALLTPTHTSGLTPIHRLRDDSSFAEGCFTPPCLCPIQFIPTLRGTLEVKQVPSTDPLFNLFVVSDVNWLVGTGASERRVVGTGTYRVAAGAGLHQMSLDLSIDGAAPVEFDSGLVPGGQPGAFPKIDISLSIANNGACFDQVFNLVSTPLRRHQIEPYALENSVYQEGCLPPCLCPLFAEQPVQGRFGLVPLAAPSPTPLPQLPPQTEWAVVRFGARILPVPPSVTPAFTPVSGFGIYQVDLLSTQTPANHRMRLQLDVGGQMDEWDSGSIPGASFPLIDIDLGVNDFFCFEQIFKLEAVPQ